MRIDITIVQVSGLGGSRSSTPNPTEVQTSEQAQEDDKILRLCSVVVNDLKEMEHAIQGLYEKTIVPLLPRYSQDGESGKITKGMHVHDALSSPLAHAV